MYFEIIWNDNGILNIDIFVKIEFNVLFSWGDLKDVTKFYFSVECRKFLRKIDSKRKFIKLNNSCNGEKTGEILIVNNDSNSQKNGSLHFNVGNNHHFFLSKRTFLHHPIQPGTVRNKSFRWFSWCYTHTRYYVFMI